MIENILAAVKAVFADEHRQNKFSASKGFYLSISGEQVLVSRETGDVFYHYTHPGYIPETTNPIYPRILAWEKVTPRGFIEWVPKPKDKGQVIQWRQIHRTEAA